MRKVGRYRRVGAALFQAFAVLALLLKAYVPSGYMVAQGGAVVVCPGMEPGAGHNDAPDPAGKHKGDHPCPFAGNAPPPLAPEAFAAPLDYAVARAAPALAWRGEAAPGRGLAAPPPPSRGPPVNLA